MIRAFDPDDLQPSIHLLDALRCHTPYRVCRPDWGVVMQTLTACMNPSFGQVLVAEHDRKLTGILIATVANIWWADQTSGPRTASDLVFHSQRYGDGRRMLEMMTEWAFSVPRVIRIEMAVSSGQGSIATAKRLYESAGFVMEGTLFTKNHPHYNQILQGQKAA
jgi:hypothetical protein